VLSRDKICEMSSHLKKIVWKRSMIIISCKENIYKLPLPLDHVHF